MIEQQKEQHTNSNQNTPLVSVGLPVYNRPELLYQALEAITTQSYKNLEIIISDDCSPGNGTRDVLNEFMAVDPRIKYIRQEKNLGPPANHRFVLEQATGEYFFWAAEDDILNEKFVQIGI